MHKRSSGAEAAPKSAGAIPGTLDLLIRRAISQERWRAILAPYEGADNRRSLLQLAVTLVLYGAAWAAMLRSVEVGYWLTAIVALPAAGLMVRLIIIQHDCGHGSYFTSQRVCNAVGSLLGVLALTPYDHWRTNHALHHAHAGNLDNRAGGDVDTLTVTEYGARGVAGPVGVPPDSQPRRDDRRPDSAAVRGPAPPHLGHAAFLDAGSGARYGGPTPPWPRRWRASG